MCSLYIATEVCTKGRMVNREVTFVKDEQSTTRQVKGRKRGHQVSRRVEDPFETIRYIE